MFFERFAIVNRHDFDKTGQIFLPMFKNMLGALTVRVVFVVLYQPF